MQNQLLLNRKLENKLLHYMYQRYIRKFGHLGHKLDELPFYITETPSEIAIKLSDTETWYPIVDLALSLEQMGLVHFNKNRTKFYLTEAGYKQVESGRIGVLLTWFNRNQGVIAFAALIISIIAFFKK
ncbi:hypothetical protein ACJBLB_03485 [Acinetobacter junii]|uniref:hypothetical protein n=1 Tax=Acinetobacter junii TaxID=40215 RepID=UPI0038624646